MSITVSKDEVIGFVKLKAISQIAPIKERIRFSFSTNLSLEKKALPKKLIFLVKVFACKKVFCKKKKCTDIKTKSSVCPNSRPFATDSPSRIRPIGLSIRSGRIAPIEMNK